MKVEEELEVDQMQERLWKEMRRQQSRMNAWSLSEQRTYIKFLRENNDIMRTTQLRKKHRVFRMLSKLLKTRTPIQVKAHHQKYQERYKNISLIIGSIEKLISNTLSSAKHSKTSKKNTQYHSSDQNTINGEIFIAQKDSMIKVQPGDQIQYKHYLDSKCSRIDWQSIMSYSYSSK